MLHFIGTTFLYLAVLLYFIGVVFAYFLEEFLYDLARHFPACTVNTTPPRRRIGGNGMLGVVLRSFGSWYDVRVIQTQVMIQAPTS